VEQSSQVEPVTPPEGLPTDPRTRIARLFPAHIRPVCRTLSRYGVPREEIADAAQEVFFAAYKCLLHGIDVTDDPGRWLNDIARRTASNVRQKTERRAEYVLEVDDMDHLTNDALGPEALASCRELLYRLLDKLDEKERSMLIAIDLEGMEWEEAAAMHGLSVSGAKRRHKSALQTIRIALERWRAQQERRGAVVMPIALATLFDADRVPYDLPESFRRSVWESLMRKIDDYEMAVPDVPLAKPAVPAAYLPPVVPFVPQVATGLGSSLGVVVCGVVSGMVVGGLIVFLLMGGRLQPAPAPAPNPAAPIPIIAMDIPANATRPAADALEPAFSASASVLAPPPHREPSRIFKGKRPDLKTEAMLINEAVAALGRGDTGAALAALMRHRERFPRGQYASKREAMMGQICSLPSASTAPACARRGSARP